MEKLKPYAFLLLGSLLYSLGFPNIFNFIIPFTPILGTAILIYHLIRETSLTKKLLFYLVYNMGINILSFYWVTNTLQEFGKLPFIIAAFMNGLYAFILNPYYWVFIILIHLVGKNFEWNNKKLIGRGIHALFIACILTIFEYWTPQQFPIMLGHPWIIFSEYLGAARYLGIPIFSFFSYLLALEICRGFLVKRLSAFNLISTLLFIFLNPFLVNYQELEKDLSLNVRLVQANISNFLKVDSEQGGYASTKEVLNRYISLSNKTFFHQAKEEKLDLIVWPETAYPYPIYSLKKDLINSPIPNTFIDIALQQKSSILFGGYEHYKENKDRSYFQTEHNAALLLNQLGQLVDTYHKQVLIPFGETLPLGPLNKWASSKVPEMAFFKEGEKFTLFKLKEKIKFISTICYEILRPEFMRDYLNGVKERPHFMINLTNDSWYGNTVEPEQHLFLARWRSVEFDLPILRSTNTGISTYIDERGRETKRLNYEVTGNLDLKLKFSSQLKNGPATFFQKYGFSAILPFWLLFFIFHVILLKLYYEKTD